MNKPKILSLDIETSPALVYTFQAYDTNIGYEQVIDPVRVLCFAAKWVGEREKFFFSEWTHSRLEMLEAAHTLLSECDAVITYHGDGFDLPILNGEFALEGMSPPPPVTSIDVLKTVKKFKLFMNKLAFVGPLLGVGEKVKHEGFGLWRKVMEGDPKAQARMRKYNIQDVVLLEALYNRVKPFIKDHPHMGDSKGLCGACGGNHIQHRGWRRTKMFKTQRIQCNSCGSWSSGARVAIK